MLDRAAFENSQLPNKSLRIFAVFPFTLAPGLKERLTAPQGSKHNQPLRR
jgi:hypothetical protein